MNDETIKEAIHAAIAQQVLAAISTEARDALLQKTLAKVLSEWQCTAAITAVLREQCEAVTRELILTPEWQARVATVIQQAMAEYLDELGAATKKMICEQMHGAKGSSYSTTYGEVLNFMKAETGATK